MFACAWSGKFRSHAIGALYLSLRLPVNPNSGYLDVYQSSTYNIWMKPIQVMFDEALLARLDASEEVRREGRSAILRRAAAEFLQRRQRHLIAEQYRAAYAGGRRGEDLAGWSEEGSWPGG